ncbi:DUF2950 family protein [Rhizobium mesoamericanum]|uniref:DUF2950 domain-containing protein n=1 Tax=Rhizobium mesoamericanum STM3625 TaxID=1211777 RepID=K0Q4M0_9HYPH|nr:DUF2950 family protein [Rhizobium mesoamericanum]CCM79527.1 conserved exported hypothetical protein [Rhizobium mesoamericanum STM3625]
MTKSRLFPSLFVVALSMLVATPSMSRMQTSLSEFAAGTPLSFDTPQSALDRLKAVLFDNDVDGLANLLGLSAAKLRDSTEAMVSYALIRQGVEQRLGLQDLGKRKVVLIGDRLWPLPFPLSQGGDGKWTFDTQVGLEEIVNRRVGENELATIQTMHDYVMAQYMYAQVDRDRDGVYGFAQKLVSSPGKQDGLYWPPGVFDEPSPASHLVQTAAFGEARRGDGYYGYRYRILTGQGDNVVGGRESYIMNGNMTRGFALIAWPVQYRTTGVQTFMVSAAGVIYQKDLGPQTEEHALSVKTFNPDQSWTMLYH